MLLLLYEFALDQATCESIASATSFSTRPAADAQAAAIAASSSTQSATKPQVAAARRGHPGDDRPRPHQALATTTVAATPTTPFASTMAALANAWLSASSRSCCRCCRCGCR